MDREQAQSVVLAFLVLSGSLVGLIAVPTETAEAASSDPTQLWSTEIEADSEGEGVAFDGDGLYAASTLFEAHKLDSSGTEIWDNEISSYQDTAVAVETDGSHGFILNENGNLDKVNSSGSVVGATSTGWIDGSVTADMDYSEQTANLYVPTKDYIYSINTSDMEVSWKKSTDGDSRDVSVDAAEERMIYSGQDSLHLVDMSDGKTLDTVSGSFHAVAVDGVDDLVYAYNSSNGYLEAYSIANGGLSKHAALEVSSKTHALEYDERSGSIVMAGASLAPSIYDDDLSTSKATFGFDARDVAIDHATRDTITVYTVGAYGTVEAWDTGLDASGSAPAPSGGTDEVSGQVVTQAGEPVANATVEVWSYPAGGFSGSKFDAMRKAEQLADETTDPIPDEVPEASPEDRIGSLSDAHVVAHKPRHWGLASTSDLSLDQGPVRQVEAGSPVVLHVRKPDSGLRAGLYPADRQLPGQTVNEKNMKILLTKLSPTGEALQYKQVPVASTYKYTGTSLVTGRSEKYVKLNLPTGIYRMTYRGSDVSTYLQVGSKQEISDVMLADLEDEAGNLTQRSQQIQDLRQDGKIVKTTVETDANGHYSASVPGDTVIASVQAYRAGGVLSDTPLGARSVSTMTEKVQQQGYNGSIYLPTKPERVEPSASGVTVTVRSTTPINSNISAYQDRRKAFEEMMSNESMTRLAGMIEERVGNGDDDLSKLKSELSQVVSENKKLREQYRETLKTVKGEDAEANLDDTSGSDSELTAEIEALQRSMSKLRGDVDTTSQTSFSGSNVSHTITLGDRFADVDPESVTVLATHNGDTTPVPDSYISVEQRTASPDQIHVSEYPVPEGSSSVVFSIKASTSDGELVASESRSVNPNFAGSRPGVAAVRLSSNPVQVGQTLGIELVPEQSTAFGSVRSVTIRTPSGTTESASLTGPASAQFTPDETGVHTVSIEFSNKGGDTFHEIVKVEAVEGVPTSTSSINLQTGTTGTYAVVSGLESATIQQVSSTSIEIEATVGDERPAEVHVNTAEVAESASTDVKLTLNDRNGMAVGYTYAMVVHGRSVGDSATVYGSGGEPVTREGGTAGELRTGDNGGAVIRTYSQDGVAEVSVDNNPGQLEQLQYEVEKVVSVPNVPLPSVDVSLGGASS